MRIPYCLVLCFVGVAWVGEAAAFLQAAPREAKVKDLALARLEVARRGLESAGTLYSTLSWLQRVLKSELILSDTPAGRTAVLEAHLQRLQKLEASVLDGLKKGAYSPADALEVQYTRLDFEVYLAEEKVRAGRSSR